MLFDDFDTQITPEELVNPDEQFETCNRIDAPDDWDFEQTQWDYMNGEYPDEGSDIDNWETEQVFQDGLEY